ncbi:hypothetical protein BTN50_1166 [Candidatus Enterovibrio altilux]|uniref:Uncharacterized protein n=1 Tax=Candidatus Enterovibrio altilux TaxID=1927128 RepID=A0A291B9K3_9GAMM|nr:hypothetical protein BTN50_1166 [Candidatus Enterovibrio luxaltus]
MNQFEHKFNESPQTSINNLENMSAMMRTNIMAKSTKSSMITLFN